MNNKDFCLCGLKDHKLYELKTRLLKFESNFLTKKNLC